MAKFQIRVKPDIFRQALFNTVRGGLFDPRNIEARSQQFLSMLVEKKRKIASNVVLGSNPPWAGLCSKHPWTSTNNFHLDFFDDRLRWAVPNSISSNAASQICMPLQKIWGAFMMHALVWHMVIRPTPSKLTNATRVARVTNTSPKLRRGVGLGQHPHLGSSLLERGWNGTRRCLCPTHHRVNTKSVRRNP